MYYTIANVDKKVDYLAVDCNLLADDKVQKKCNEEWGLDPEQEDV